MTADQSRVDPTAIADAVRIIEGLHGRDRHSLKQFTRQVQDALDTWGHSILTQAFMLLIGVGCDPNEVPRISARAPFSTRRCRNQPHLPRPLAAGGFPLTSCPLWLAASQQP
jgi:hypothetical protein